MKFIKYAWLCSLPLIASEEGAKIASPYSSLIVDTTTEVPLKTSTTDSPIHGNASGTFLKEKENHYRTFAEFLYWKRSSATPFVSDATGWMVPPLGQGLNSDIPIAKRGKAYLPEFDFAPGFNVGIGFDFARDEWDLEGSYLWLRSEASRGFSMKPGSGWTPPYFFTGETTSQVNFGREKTEETLNFFQLELGRKFFISKRMLLRPHIDIASLYVPRTLTVFYDFLDTTPTHFAATYSSRSHLLGFGGGVGLDTEWRLSHNWAFLGNFTINTIWTNFKAKQQQKETNFTTGAIVQNVLGGLSTNKILYLVDIFLGVEWWTKFYKDKCFVSIYSGWDFFTGLLHYYSGGQLTPFSDPYDYQGLRAGFKLGF